MLVLLILGGATQLHAAGPPRPATLLPPGYLHTRGSAFVSDQDIPVRLACVQWHGLSEKNSTPDGWDKVSLSKHLQNMVAAGFNCIRVEWTDGGMTGSSMDTAKQIITAAGPVGLRVILDHHNNEGMSHDPTGWACFAQQLNGLWFDKGPGTDGTDGCNDPGTVTAADFQRHWVELARMYAGNPTLLAVDLDNEPTNLGITWGGNGPKDIHAMCTDVGNAIHAVNPGVLIGCPCPMNYQRSFVGADVAPEGDCTKVASKPVVLKVPHKVFYIVHEYPKVISGMAVDSGPAFIRRMNHAWGYLITEDLAPVWVGEIGASLDQNSKNLPDETAWAATIGPYLNGKATGGLRIPPGDQGVSTNWMGWLYDPNAEPDGVLQADWQSIKPQQRALFGQWRQDPVRKSGQVSGPEARRN